MEPGEHHIEGMALGAVTDWFDHKTARVSKNISSFKFLVLLLAGWFSTQAQGFMFTTIQCNKNYAAVMHVDGHDCGPSAIISLGHHTGGELWVWDPDGSVPCQAVRDIPGWCSRGDYLYGKTLDIHNRLTIIDGRRPHAVLPFTGERYSLVFYCTESWAYATREQEEELRALKFVPPSAFTLRMMRRGLGMYEPELVLPTNKDGEITRRFIQPKARRPAPDPDEWTVGVDCCGLLNEFVGVQELFGASGYFGVRFRFGSAC